MLGFLLSPLSWWNDIYVNIPLAYVGAWIVSLIYKPAFLTAFVVNYWITNILGLVLMRRGINKLAKKEGTIKPYGRKDIMKDIFISLAYTALMVALIKLKAVRPVKEYFSGRLFY